MRNFKLWIKSLFGYYEEGYEYLVSLDKIHIQQCFRKTKIGDKKWRRKKIYFFTYGKCESKIILEITPDGKFVLVDGYTSYLIHRKYDKNAKVPVYFRNTNGLVAKSKEFVIN